MEKILLLFLTLIVLTIPAFAQFDGQGNFYVGDVTGGDYIKYDQYGRASATGDSSVVWDDIRTPVSQTKVNPATDKPDLVTFLGNTKVLGFDPSSDEGITFVIQMPHNYKLGTNLDCHVHWTPSNTNNGDVAWVLEYTFQDIDGGAFAATDTVSAMATGGGTAYAHQNQHFARTIDGSGISNISAMLIGYLYRDVSLNDDYNADALLLEIDFHYIIDTRGSRTETAK